MTYYVKYINDDIQDSIAFPSSESNLFVKKTDRCLFIHIPSKSNNLTELVLSLGFLGFLDSFFLKQWSYKNKITWMIFCSIPLPIPIWFVLLNFLTTFIEINHNKFRIQYCLFNRSIIEIKGKTKNITKIEVCLNQTDDCQIQTYGGVIWENMQSYKFGDFLEKSENEWLISEIKHFVHKIQYSPM
ncbi:MAG: hypothetical protein AAF378_22050 [Cyanobacteria bacterium P01_A01_bin.84]